MKNILIKLLAFFLIVTFSYAQEDDDMFLDDIGEKNDIECIPEDLSVVFDSLTGSITDQMEVAKLYSFGSEYHKNKNYKDAMHLLWKVYLNDNGKRANLAIGKIAESYVNLGFVDSSLIACYKGFEKFPDNQKLHYWAGYIQDKLGRSACAIPHYEALVEKNGKNVSYLNTLAFLYYKEGDCRSIEMQRRAIEIEPSNPKLQEALANYMSACGESPRLAYKDAWDKDNTNFRAGRQYAEASIDEGFYQDAVEPLSKIISAEPTAEDYKLRAGAYENLSKNYDAINDLNEWLKLEPNNADIMLSIAVNYTAVSKFSSANSWIAKAIRKKPSYGKPYIVRGEMYEAMVSHCQQGQVKLEDKIVYEEAMFIYEKAKKDPGFKAIANTKINNLKPFIRLPEQIFMEPNAQVVNSCYDFLVGKKGVKN